MKKLLKVELEKISILVSLLLCLVLLIARCASKNDATCFDRLKHINIFNKPIIGQSIDSLKSYFKVKFDSESSVPYDTTIVFLNHPTSSKLTKKIEMFKYYTFFVGKNSNKVLAFQVNHEFTTPDNTYIDGRAFSEGDVIKIIEDIKKNYTKIGFNIDSIFQSTKIPFKHQKLTKKDCDNYQEKLEIIDTCRVRNYIMFQYKAGESKYIIDYN